MHSPAWFSTATTGPEPSNSAMISNDDEAPSLTIVKQVVNDDGGEATVTDFGITTSAGTLTFDAGDTVGDTTTYTAELTGLAAGEAYTLIEADVDGYSEGTWDCSPNEGGGAFGSGAITLEPGEDATCLIVNDDIVKEDIIFQDGFELK